VDIGHLMFAAAVMMGATAVAIGVAKKLNLGVIAGLLVVGMALGPHSPRPLLTAHVSDLQAIGEIGVTLLIFAVGLEIQPASLWAMRRLVFGLGTTQYVITTVAIFAFLIAIAGTSGIHWQSALVIGLGLAMSSTAIALPSLQERGDQGTAHGRAAVAIDISQGFFVVPVLALIPVLSAGLAQGEHGYDAGRALEVVAALAGVYALGRVILPWALTLTARDLGPSGFAVIVLAGVFFAGWWMDTVGLSMALGAFIVGVLLSSTAYADQIKAAVAPAKQLMLAVFFIAIGMAIDLKQVAELKGELLLYVPAILFIKLVILFALARLFRLGLRSAILTALLMTPFDEIGYVILANAKANGLLARREYAVGLSAISFSFVISPLLINLGYKFSERMGQAATGATAGAVAGVAGHAVVVAGYGYVGRAICAMLERAQIPYTAFETDPHCLAIARKAGHNVRYGDVTEPGLMDTIGIASARLVVVAARQYGSTKHMAGNLRQFYPRVPAMSAVQYLAQRDELQRMGATNVVALTPEGALSFGASVLGHLGIALKQTESIVSMFRADDYAALRRISSDESAVAA
jgi:glutathione-regulated potassium-efflux system ancillary protein KefC